MTDTTTATTVSHLARQPRLPGLDLLRGLSMLGMVLVNFRLAMGVDAPASSLLGRSFLALEGRTAAIFVVLAGMGLVLGAVRQSPAQARAQAWRRAFWLALLGLLNVTVFPADILHFYACYFALGAFFLGVPARRCMALALLLPWLYVLALLNWNYEQGWDWATLSYVDFWQAEGFVRHLLFNGFHPILPWMAFFLWGMALAGLPLTERRWQERLAWGGALVFLACLVLREALPRFWPAAAPWLGSSPLPPTPLYMFSAGGLATALIGAALLWAPNWPALRALGRSTLSVYLAHIVLGMGTLEAMGWLSGRSLAEVAAAGLLFGALALVGSWAWLRRFPQGPLEMLMRRLSAPPGAARPASPGSGPGRC